MARAREKGSTDNYRTLNIGALKRERCFQPGSQFECSWWRRGEKVASIGIAVESKHALRLRYKSSRRGRDSVQHDYSVPITWTACHLGGERPWFLCPCCDRRVAKLYSCALFACRHCVHLNYRSQQVSKRDRHCFRSWTLRQALGCDEGLLFTPAELVSKPKGMHWQTFARKVKTLKDVDARALTSLLVVID